MNTLPPPLRISVAALLLAAATSAVAIELRTETFDSGLGRFSTASGNTADGNSFNWVNSNLTAGASGAGEIGGVFARTPGFSFLGDTALGGSFSRTADLVMSGELVMTANNAANGSIALGYFNTANLGGESIGFNIAEPDPGPAFRAFLMIRNANGTQSLSAPFSLTLNTPITFSLTYDGNPDGSGTLSGMVGGTPLTVSAGAGGTGTFNGFGLGAGYVGTGEPTMTATAFADNLSYNAVVPEPTGAALLLLGGAALGVLRRPRRERAVGNS